MIQPPPPMPGATQRVGSVLKKIVLFAALLLFGLIAGVILGELLRSRAMASGRLTLLHLLWLIPIIYLVITVHELGHLAAAAWVKFRFFLLTIGPLRVTRVRDGLAVSFNRNPFIFGGLAAALPTEFHHLRRRMAIMIAGGPLASLLFGLLLWRLTPWLGRVTPLNTALLGLTAFCSLAIGAVALIPMRSSGFMSDGGQLWTLWRKPEQVEMRQVVLMMHAASQSGVRPRDWDAALLQRGLAQAEAGGSNNVGLRYLGYLHALDRGDISGAGDLLNQLLQQPEQMNNALRPACFLEAAYFAAFHDRNLETAQAWLALAQGGLVSRETRLRAMAAVALEAGDVEAAQQMAATAIGMSAASADRGGALAETEWLQAIIAQTEALQGSGQGALPPPS